MYTQKSRLPVARDPHSELFRCERFAATLTKTSCTNRRQLALRGDFVSIAYASCRGCPVGEKHAAELPHLHQQEGAKPMEQQQEANGKAAFKYAPRMCRRGRHEFQPADDDPKGQVCPEHAKAPKPSKLAKLRMRQQLKAKMAKAAPQPKPKPVPVLAKGVPTITPLEWLTLGGFKLQTIETPAGTFLRVS